MANDTTFAELFGEVTQIQYENKTIKDFNESWFQQFDQSSCYASSNEDPMNSTIFQTSVCVLYSAVFIVALFGNGLVCFVVQTSPRMKTVTNYFIVNLAVGDILMALFCIPFSFVSQLVLGYWPFGLVMCKLVNYSQAVSVLVSAYTLVAISLDRYTAIMSPLRPRLGRAGAKLIVLGVWIGAFATAAPIPVVSKLERPSPWHNYCRVDLCHEKWSTPEQMSSYTSALLALQFALPLTVLICTYARIAHAVWGGRPPGEAQTARDTRMHTSKRKMIKMMVMVVIVFTVCWLPLNVFIVMWTIHDEDADWSRWPGLPYLWFASHWLAMSHSCYNPIIYCYMNARYRRGFQQVLNNIFCLKHEMNGRGCRRSSLCDGHPMSEFLHVNGTAIVPSLQRRTTCISCGRRQKTLRRASTCTSCASLRVNNQSKSAQPPAQALSLRSNF